MISGFQLALIIGAALCAIYSSNIPRASLWILAGAASFIASTAWSRYGFGYPPAFTLTIDASLSLALYLAGDEKWEVRLANIFRAQVLVSLVYLAGPVTIFGTELIFNHGIYIICLEVLNWIALSVIWDTARKDRIARHEDVFGHNRVAHFHSPRLGLRAQRAHPPFTKVRK